MHLQQSPDTPQKADRDAAAVSTARLRGRQQPVRIRREQDRLSCESAWGSRGEAVTAAVAVAAAFGSVMSLVALLPGESRRHQMILQPLLVTSSPGEERQHFSRSLSTSLAYPPASFRKAGPSHGKTPALPNPTDTLLSTHAYNISLLIRRHYNSKSVSQPAVKVKWEEVGRWWGGEGSVWQPGKTDCV